MNYYNVKYIDFTMKEHYNSIIAHSAQDAADLTRDLEGVFDVLTVWSYESEWH